MNIFKLLTPATYWLLALMWAYILLFYIRRLRSGKVKNLLFTTLIIILAIDAFRTLFEKAYFGIWYTSMTGFLPRSMYDFLVRPEIAIIPKLINISAAVIVIGLLLRLWLADEASEIERQNNNLKELKATILERDKTESILKLANKDIEKEVEKRTEELTRTRNQLQQNYDTQSVISSVLQFSLEDIPLDKILEKTIELILSIKWLSIESKGCIFTVDKESRVLTMKAQKGLPAVLTKDCVRLPVGKCLCGRAALKKSAVFTNDIDNRHDILPEGIQPHGHYCIPILHNNKLLGVINVYTKKGHKYNENEQNFLMTVADTLATIILRNCAETEKNKLKEELQQAQQMEMLGQLTSGVAHEVRNPLNAIIAVSEALFQDIGEKGEYSEYLYHIRNQVDRLSQLMKDLLDLGRPINLAEMQPVSLHSICSASMESWKQSDPQNKNRLSVIEASDYEDVKIKADTTKLQQVFINLIENAVQHSTGQEKITIQLMKPEDNECRIQITDNGPGIKEEILNRVFEPFFTTRKKGTGLGLSIVKHILKMHGGNIKIWNNSRMNGCTVEVQLPVYR